MFIINAQRISTMRNRLGKEASKIIKNDNFLPMFRNRQKNYQDEFNQSVEIAKRKNNPTHYLAKIWAKNNVEKSLKWLRSFINRAKVKLADLRHQARMAALEKKYQERVNQAGRDKLEKLINDSKLFSLRQ